MAKRQVDILTLVEMSKDAAGTVQVPAHLVATDLEFNDRDEADGELLNHWQAQRKIVWGTARIMAARYAQELQALDPDVSLRTFTAAFLRHYHQLTGKDVETLRRHLKLGWWFPETITRPTTHPDIPPEVVTVQDPMTKLGVYDAALEVLAYGADQDPIEWVLRAIDEQWSPGELTQQIRAALDPKHSRKVTSHRTIHAGEYSVQNAQAIPAYVQDALRPKLADLPTEDPKRGRVVGVKVSVTLQYERTAEPVAAKTA